MGEVYRARDTRLDRTVAIKLLPPQLAADPQFRERFDREARTISQLTHANVCTLYDVGDAPGSGPHAPATHFLVMEYLEGETLAARLARGRLPLSEALRIASEIASALDHAHGHGIVHRDLKPGNVMLTKSGAKLLDFGLAKETRTVVDVGATGIATMAAPLTAQGAILGTVQYMAPEQIEGNEPDARTDIFAFGVVLYEMLTGRPPFEGSSSASLLGAILKDDPAPVSQLLPVTPPALDHLVRSCLAKHPDERFQTVRDVLLELKWIAGSSSSGAIAAPLVGGRKRRERVIWVAAGLLLAVLTGGAVWRFKSEPSEPPLVSRWQHPLPENQYFTSPGRRVVAISPDGTKFAYVASRQLHVRSLDQLEARPLPGTDESAFEPVFSPDGKWIVYFAPVSTTGQVDVRKVSVTGGAPVTLGRLAASPFGATWRGDLIVFGLNSGSLSAVQAIPESGGTPRTLVSVDGKTERAVQPQLLEDRQHIVFSIPSPVATGRESGSGEGPIVVQRIDGTDRKVLVGMGLHPRVLPTGHLVYVQNGTLFAVPFDSRRLEITGDTVPLVAGIQQSGGSSVAHFAISDTGTLVYARGAGTTSRSLLFVDRGGAERPLAALPNTYQQPRLSPDRTRLAVTAGGQIWVWTFATGTLMRLSANSGANHYNPAWMGDRHVVFDSNDGSGVRILRKSADGAGAEDVLVPAPAGYPEIVTPDGKLLIYHPLERVAMVMPLEPGGEARSLLPGVRGQVSDVELSPDQRWIAYESNESGHFEIYVRPFPAVDAGRWQISSSGGQHPLWSRDGRELFFIAADGMMTGVPVQLGTNFSHGRPEGLFSAGQYYVNVARCYDQTPDGRGFIMVKAAGTGRERQSIVVATNWFEELRARMRTAER
jgi:serine/threonine-protein kinase